jgi:hypothetical protein
VLRVTLAILITVMSEMPDWNRIEDDIYEASRASFAELLDQAGKEGIYAFCLYTDSDGGSVVPSANTEAGHRESLERAGECTERTKRYYRWAPEEWKYVAFGGDHFNAICETLFSVSVDDQFGQVAGAMTRALDRLRTEKTFTRLAEAPTLFVSVSDDNRAESIENESAKVLNNAERLTIFLQRYNVL